MFVLCLRVLTTLLCIGFIAWIFSNSLKDATQSTEQSAGVMTFLQTVFQTLAPQSSIATATGEAYDRIHKIVRLCAHFAEFALLGAMLVWCWRTYTRKKVWFILPSALAFTVPFIDEFLQSFTVGRALEWTDIGLDIAGGICGGLFALCTLWLAFAVKRKREKGREAGGEGEFGNRVDRVQ